MGTTSLHLQNGSENIRVTRLLLHSEMNRLPVLLVKVIVPTGGTPPTLGKPYTLGKQNDNDPLEYPFGIDKWYLQSFFQLPTSTGPATQYGYLMQLTAVPGQMLQMKAYATDSGENLNRIVTDLCGKFSSVPLQSSGSSAENLTLDTVISVGETLEQFLRRMALGSNQWFFAYKHILSDDLLQLSWQDTLQGSTDAGLEIGDSIKVVGTLTAPQQVRKYWPRALYKPDPAAQLPANKDFCVELINALPLKLGETGKATDAQDGGTFGLTFILGDQPELARAWPGLVLDDPGSNNTIALSVLHLFDEDSSGGSSMAHLLRRGVPGLTDQDVDALALNSTSHYSVLVVGGARGASHAGSRAFLDRFGTRQVAGEAARSMGLMFDSFPCDDTGAAPESMIATVAAWDEAKSATWAAGSPEGQLTGHITEIKVKFPWSEIAVRVPYAYAMDGADGLVFFPPSAGDRVLVLLDRLWPIAALNAAQYSSIRFPPEFQYGATGNSLSAPRGALVRGGLLFKTLNIEGPYKDNADTADQAIASSGDVVIHAAGDLILRAEGNIILDGTRLWDYGRPGETPY